MPDENQNPANLNNQEKSSQNQPSGDQTSGQPTVEKRQSSSQPQQQADPDEVQEEINKVAGQAQPQATQTTGDKPGQPPPPPKPVVEETSASAPPPAVDTGDDTPPPPPPGNTSQDQTTTTPSPSGGSSGDQQNTSQSQDSTPSPSSSPPPPPGGDSGSAPPSQPPNIPPVVTSPTKKKKKFGGKKVVATILGLLLLVGGIGAGVILVQQQQDIREEAKIIGECESDADCGAGFRCNTSGPITQCEKISTPQPPPPGDDGGGGEQPAPGPVKKANGESCTSDSQCQSNNCDSWPEVPGGSYCAPQGQEDLAGEGEVCTDTSDCQSGLECKYITGYPKCTSQEGGIVLDGDGNGTGGGEVSGFCSTGGSRGTTNNINAKIRISNSDASSCLSKCQDNNTCQLWITRYKCDSNNLPQGCQDNGQDVVGEFSAQSPSSPTCKEAGFDTGTTCGTQQLDIGCKDKSGTYGTMGFLSYVGSNSCSTSTSPPGGPGISAQCLEVKAFDEEWNSLTASDLSSLQPGDTVRFTVSGTTTSGTIDKARFVVNGQTQPEVTQKRPGTNEFFYEYTIPEDLTTFRINAQLHHTNTDIGWF